MLIAIRIYIEGGGKMVTPIEINKEVATLLWGLGYKHYPLVIPEDTSLPVVIYNRVIDYEDTQNNDVEMGKVIVTIDVLTAEYGEGVEMLNNIYNVFKSSGYNIISVNEDYVDGIYQQTIVFEKYVLI